jgi:hypothetical protein
MAVKYICLALLFLLAVAVAFMAPGIIRDFSVPEFDNDAYQAALEDENFLIKPRSQTVVWNQMHHMANTLIVADAIWGELFITEELVNGLILEVHHSQFDDKDRLLEILERWKKGDFRQGVDDHNYVWERLGGTVGRATDLRREYRR